MPTNSEPSLSCTRPVGKSKPVAPSISPVVADPMVDPMADPEVVAIVLAIVPNLELVPVVGLVLPSPRDS